MSLVDVSVSMLTQLNVRSAIGPNASASSAPATSASVNNTAIIVAMSGSIIPAPLAMPTTRAVPPSITAAAIFARVSVVIIALAAPSTDPSGSCSGIAAIPLSIRSIGYRRPMTPVDATSTSATRHPRRSATAVVTARLSSSPAGPLATLALRDTTTIAWAVESARLARLAVTHGAANRLRVNTPAAATGRSAAMTTKSSCSSLTPRLAT